MNRRKLVAAAVLALTAGVAAAAVTIDVSKACIFAPQGNDRDKWAAEQLQTHLKLITGAEAPIVLKEKDIAKDCAYRFNVGVVPEGETTDAFRPEECRWRVTDAGAWFWGIGGFANKSQQPKFAVIDFLENSLDVRWPCWDYIIYDAQPGGKLTVEKTEGGWAPTVQIRTVRGGNGKTAGLYADYMNRMRHGRHFFPNVGHAWIYYWNRFGKDHPDWFAMNKKGSRVPDGVDPAKLNDPETYKEQRNLVGMCVSNEGFQDQVVKDWAETKKPFMNLCANDIVGDEECQCPKCLALDEPPVKSNGVWNTYLADRYVWFMHRVLEKAKKIRPDVKANFYVYNATLDAPRRERIDGDFIPALGPVDMQMDEFKAFIRSWKDVGLKTFWFNPIIHHYYVCYYLPMGHEEYFNRLMHVLLDEGCIGFDYDCPKSTPRHYGTDSLDRYVTFHTMQDPTKPFDYWLDHYFRSYGAAAADAKAYHNVWRQNFRKRIEPNIGKLMKLGTWFNVGRGLQQNVQDYFTEEDFAEAEKFLKAAEAKGVTGPQAKMVERLRVTHDNALLTFRVFCEKKLADGTKPSTQKLIDFREAHGISPYMWEEQYFGDLTGVRAKLGPSATDYKKKKQREKKRWEESRKELEKKGFKVGN